MDLMNKGYVHLPPAETLRMVDQLSGSIYFKNHADIVVIVIFKVNLPTIPKVWRPFRRF